MPKLATRAARYLLDHLGLADVRVKVADEEGNYVSP